MSPNNTVLPGTRPSQERAENGGQKDIRPLPDTAAPTGLGSLPTRSLAFRLPAGMLGFLLARSVGTTGGRSHTVSSGPLAW